MKKTLFSLLSALFLSTAGVQAQGFITEHSGDTVSANTNGAASITVNNNIKSGTSNSVVVTWKIIDSHIAPGMGFGGFCDNNMCRDSANALAGVSYTSDPYGTSFNLFDAIFNDFGAANGSTSWVRVYVSEGPAGTIGGTTRTLTFIARKNSTGISNTGSASNVNVYPNPAREAINVTFNKQAGIKTIAIYNMIGNTMRVFKPTDDNSARLDLDNIPSGVYFLRLINAEGNIIATRRFTRQ